MLCLMLISIGGCQAPAAIANACVWLSKDQPEAGFETRWTRNEKVWALQYNDKLAAFCGAK